MKATIAVKSLGIWSSVFAVIWFSQHSVLANEHGYITTEIPTVLFSINDGETASWSPFELTESVRDSITVIRLSKDRPPVTRTVYGTTWNSIMGSPHAAIVGRYGIVTNHRIRTFAPDTPAEITGPNQIVVVDLESEDLPVVSRVSLTNEPWLALAHPDGQRVIVAVKDHWRVFEIDEGKIIDIAQSKTPGRVYSFDISSDGKTIVAVMTDGWASSAERGIYHFSMNTDSSIDLVGEVDSGEFTVDGPFSPRISPDGTTALVLNSLGDVDGKLDDVLVLNIGNKIRISQNIKQVCDGLESLAFHPSGKFAVIACLNNLGPVVTSHLAVVDLTDGRAEVLYHTPIERIPEGIEFTPDGTKLFVGTTLANHIVVYQVEGTRLVRSPYVLITGYGPSALTLSTE